MQSTSSNDLEIHASQIAWGAGIFGVSLACSVAAVLFVLLRLPPHYFHSGNIEPFWPNRPPWQRMLGRAMKNLLGFSLVVLGLLMSIPGVPGQGLLTMFIGIVLMDFSGKRSLERRIVSVPTILHGCNRLRARFGKPALTMSEPEKLPNGPSAPESIVT